MAGLPDRGVHCTASVRFVNVSGQSGNERILLFQTPENRGLTWVVDRAEACGATVDAAVADAQVYAFPQQKLLRRVLVVDGTAVIHLQAPTNRNMPELIRSALRRARGA